MKLDPEAFLDLANQVTKLNMFPYFDMAHCIITCLYLREDLAAGTHVFSRKHPLSCWASCMLSIFGGVILSNFLLGEPVLAPFKSTNYLLLASLAWYLTFYTPFDCGYKLCKFLPVKVILSLMKEIVRVRKVHDGVVHAAKVYPNGYLIMMIIGTTKGNGGAFLKIMERLFRGVWTPSAMELMQLSFPTKACIAASVIFIIDKKTELISAPHALVYFGVVIFFIYFKLSSILLGIHDPFAPFENLFCFIFLGGIWDTLSRFIASARGEAAQSKPEPAKEVKVEAAKKKE